MSRDYSKFFLNQPPGAPPTGSDSELVQLGWQSFFAQQIDADALRATPPVRVIEVHRNALHVLGDGLDTTIPPVVDTTVGDWILLDPDAPQNSIVLKRKSVLKRKAPGTERAFQLIAANVDTVFIVTSCNHDFNIARLERYVALAFDADAAAVILITKADQCDDSETFAAQARKISDVVPVIPLDARGDAPRRELAPWCRLGETVCFLGSSGVGKSTLTNALIGNANIATQTIREDDSRGRHTTTRRQLHRIPSGCLVVDTPGMRELQLADVEGGIDDVFQDIAEIAKRCRFRDCQHDSEPDCAVREAVDTGQIDSARFGRWRKLKSEEAFNSSSLSERKQKDKALGKIIRQFKPQNRK